jgi:hypothetical protein
MSTLSKLTKIVRHNYKKSLAREPKVLLYVYQMMDHKPLNSADGIYSLKVGDHWCIFRDIYAAAKRRIREGLGCHKAALDDGRIKILAVFDVTVYAKHHKKYKKHGKIDLNVHKVIPGHYRDDNFHVNDIGEVLALITKEINRYSTAQQKDTLKLSPLQHDLLRDSIVAYKAGKLRQLFAAAARIGKTCMALALMRELNLPFMVFASYVTTSLNSMIQDAAKFAQFHNILVVDTRKNDYQQLISEGLAAGKQIVALLSMCNGDDRQERIDFLFKLNLLQTLVVDEADYGSHQPTQTEPLQAAVSVNELVILMSGTNPERSMSTWKIDFQRHISNQDMQVARGLYLRGEYKQSPSKMLFFKKDYSILGAVVPARYYQMTLKKLQDLAKLQHPEAFTDDELWGSWIKWMKNPAKASGPLSMFFESVFEGKWNLEEVNTRYQFSITPGGQQVVMVWLPSCTETEKMNLFAEIAQKSLKNWDVIPLSGGVTTPDGTRMTGAKAERHVNERIASAKFNGNRNVMIISAIMGARSFGIKEITEVYLCYDEGAVGSTIQKMSRALTPFFDGTEKLARIVSCSFDPNRDEKFDPLVLECAKHTKALYGIPLVKAIKLVLRTSDFFVMTQDGPKPYEISAYLEGVLARKSTARVFGKIFKLENIPTDLLESIARVSGKIGKTTKQEVAQRGKTLAEVLKKSPGTKNTPAQDKIWKDIHNGLVYIASNIDWIMCFGRRGASLVECLDILDKETQRTRDGLAEDYGIPYADLARLLRCDVSSHDLLELESYAGTGTASNRTKFSIDPVVMEMLAIIPEKDWQSSTKTFADLAMAGGQFIVGLVRMLRTYGHSDENIRSRVFGFDTCKHRILAAKYHCPDLIGTFEVKTIEELMKMTQKFDVIVGNPPFQQNSKIAKDSGTNKLWNKFTKLAIDLSPGGYVTYITPQSWLVGNRTFDLLTSKKSISVNTEISHYFQGVNSSFCSWVLSNKDKDDAETGKIFVNGKPLDSSLGLIPKDRSHNGLSLVAKFFSKKDKFSFDRLYNHGSTAIKNDPTLLGKKSQRYQHPITFTASKQGIAWSRIPSPVQGKKKVIIFRSAPIKPTYSTNGVGADAFFKLVTSKEEGKNMVEIFNSKLYSYIFKTTLYSGFFSMSVFNHIPYLDYTRSWSDAEIYEHFNITKKEQAHIEAYLA